MRGMSATDRRRGRLSRWRSSRPAHSSRSKRSHTSRTVLERLPELGRVQDALGDPRGLHVVGGTVRDLLLGNPGTDLDLVREGPVEELAGELADRLGGRAVLHGRFGTAVVT